jgi:phosphatidylserine decarboxylase
MLVYCILGGALVIGVVLDLLFNTPAFAYAGAAVWFIGLFFWKYVFLRDPARRIPKGKSIVSPADGKVIEIKGFVKEDFISKGKFGKIMPQLGKVGERGTIISIFMSPLNVHINRAPIAGKVIFQQHTNGRFLVASSPRAFIENERNEIVIQGRGIRVGVIQIAGALARRIVSIVEVGRVVEKGQRIGLINLGSQVSVVLPEGIKPLVKVGDRVKAGESVIA